MKKCDILREYSKFIDTVRAYSGEESAIKKAIRECIDRGILVDYLKRKGSEVENMLIAEYSYEEDIQVKQQEAKQQGMEEATEKVTEEGIKKMVLVLKELNVPQQTILLKIQNQYDLSSEVAERYL